VLQPKKSTFPRHTRTLIENKFLIFSKKVWGEVHGWHEKLLQRVPTAIRVTCQTTLPLPPFRDHPSKAIALMHLAKPENFVPRGAISRSCTGTCRCLALGTAKQCAPALRPAKPWQ